MFGAGRQRRLEKEQLENWLAQVLVPVEPNARFIKRLRARLVRYQGGGFSWWMVVVALASGLLLLLTLLGMLVRFVLAWIGLIKLINHRRQAAARPPSLSS